MVFGHELVHLLERARSYSRLYDFVKSTLGEQEFEARALATAELYEKSGKNVTDESARREVVAAFIADKLFSDEASIAKLTREKPSLARRIRSYLSELLARVSRDADKANLIRAQRLYEKAFSEYVRGNSTENKGSTKCSFSNVSYDPETASIQMQLQHYANELNQMDVVGKATVPESFKSKHEAAAWAIETLQKTGYQVDRQGVGKIYFNPNDINYGVNYADTNAEKAAFAVIDKVIKRGIIIGSHENHKGRGKQTFTIGAPVELNGIRGNVGVVINKNGNHYYTHRILFPDGTAFVFSDEKEARREPYRGVTENRSLADTTSLTSKNSISQVDENVKGEFAIRQRYSPLPENLICSKIFPYPLLVLQAHP